MSVHTNDSPTHGSGPHLAVHRESLLLTFVDRKIVAPCVERTARSTYSGFIKRAQWKGSAMPILAEKVILKLWEAQDKGEKADWRGIVAEMGSPLII